MENMRRVIRFHINNLKNIWKDNTKENIAFIKLFTLK